MGERVEAKLAMVGPHPARAHASEGKLLHAVKRPSSKAPSSRILRQVHQGVVDEESPAGGPGLELLLHLKTVTC